MKEMNNATCAICGRGYHMCISCKDAMNLNPWKRYTDTSEHYKIYQILHGYNTKIYTKEEAKLKLKTVDLSDFDNLRENIKNIITDITYEDEQTVDDTEFVNLSNELSVSIKNDNDVNVNNKQNIIRKRKSFKVVETE